MTTRTRIAHASVAMADLTHGIARNAATAVLDGGKCADGDLSGGAT